jgi:hypothetical protein
MSLRPRIASLKRRARQLGAVLLGVWLAFAPALPAFAGAGFPPTTAGALPAASSNTNAAAGKIGEFIQVGGGNAPATVTMTIASPAVISDAAAVSNANAANGITIGSVVNFTTTGALPTGLSVGTNYYVIAPGFTAGTSYEVSTTPGGTAVNTSGTQSGTQTRVNTAFGFSSGSAQNIGVVPLTAGDWDCRGNTDVATNGATTVLQSWIGPNSNSFTGLLFPSFSNNTGSFTAPTQISANGTTRITLSAPASYYLEASATFSTGSASATGTLQCRRAA